MPNAENPTALAKVPDNKNTLSRGGFQLVLQRAPMLNFFSQRVNLPGISIDPPSQGNPFTSIPHSGEHIHWEPLAVTFKVDEDMANWLEVFNWMRGLGFPNRYDEYKALYDSDRVVGQGIRSEASVFILSSHRNPIFEVKFRDCFPVSLTGLDFDSTLSSVEYHEATVVFTYISYEITPVT